MEKLIELTCVCCNKKFNRALREQKRNLKKGRKTYCSRECSSKYNIGITLLSKESREKSIKTSKLNKELCPDLLSPFKVYLRIIRRRVTTNDFSKNKNVGIKHDITLKYLKELWEKQKGICPYSGIKLTHLSQTEATNAIYTASVDRIDSLKGYLQGNIQYVSRSINYMKGQLTNEQTIEICKLIAKNYKDIC